MPQSLVFGTIAWWEVFLAGISTLAIFSFLIKENSFYRFFEHLFIGIASGWGLVATVRNFLWPLVLKPMLGWDRLFFPDGTVSEPYNKAYLLFLAPMLFGMLFYFILSKRRAWLAELVIGLQLGFAGGMAFQGAFTELLPQIFDSFRPLIVHDSWFKSLSNMVFVFTLVTSLFYFFFTFKRRPGGVVEKSSIAGRWLMMGCFGAFFGSTIMARMSLLVERLDFLIHDWLGLFLK